MAGPYLIRHVIGLALIASFQLPVEVDSISCYECSSFPGESGRKCPGTVLVNYGLKYDACVVYQLGNGTIVYQNGGLSESLSSPCTKRLDDLTTLLDSEFQSRGRAMCCQSEGCNANIPRHLMTSNSSEIFLEKYKIGTGQRQTTTSAKMTSGNGAATICVVKFYLLLFATFWPLTF